MADCAMAGRILFLNGSIRGDHGNSRALLDRAAAFLPPGIEAEHLTLTTYSGSVAALAAALASSSALVFGTGVYWSSWGSPLQRFLEVMTSYELSDCFLGKPAAVIASVDSVGGADVVARLQGVLSFMGCLIPPLSSVVISRAGLRARREPGFEDVFSVEDLGVLIGNLVLATDASRAPWRTWDIARVAAVEGAFPHAGPLLSGLDRLELE